MLQQKDSQGSKPRRKPDERLSEFDELRKARNAVNYYGKELTAEEAREVIETIKKLRTAVLELLEQQKPG